MRTQLATLTIAAALASAISITACTTTKTEKPAAPQSAATSLPSFGGSVNDVPVPKCLNVQEGDRHVEFSGDSLYLAESGQPKQLILEQGAQVRCEKLQILRNARKPSVLIEYATPEEGVAYELKIAIATIENAKWVLKPVTVKRQTAKKSVVEKTVKWTEDKNGKAILTLSDSTSKKTIKP